MEGEEEASSRCVTKDALAQAHSGTATTVLVQLHGAHCPRCPAFGEAIGRLANAYQFDLYHCDVGDDECDLVEEFQVKTLPAVLLRKRGASSDWVMRENCSHDELALVVRQNCLPMVAPVLVLDADF